MSSVANMARAASSSSSRESSPPCHLVVSDRARPSADRTADPSCCQERPAARVTSNESVRAVTFCTTPVSSSSPGAELTVPTNGSLRCETTQRRVFGSGVDSGWMATTCSAIT